MRIDHAGGDVIDVARDVAEATVLWMCSGFNRRSGAWRFGLRDTPLRPLTPEARADRPWLSEADSIWELEPPLNQLRYVYVLSNPSDAKGYTDLESVDAAIARSLDALCTHGVRRIAMIHIPFTAGTTPSHEEELAAAEAMIRALRSWDASHQGRVDSVVLVDLQDAFSDLL